MPTFYNYTEGGQVYSFDDVFVPADAFRQGNLWGWGQQITGRSITGDNSEVTRVTPVTTFAGGTNWKQVSVGWFHTASIKTDGTLWVWGQNYQSVLGNNSGDRSTPVTTFAGGTNWKQVDCGTRSMAAIKTDGTLWIWGGNGYGILGNNIGSGTRVTPVTTFAGGTNWKQVSCVRFSTAAVKTDGTLWTWGRNAYAELGVSDTFIRCTPVTTFAGGNNWKQVCAGYTMSAIKTDGTLWLWGRGTSGQLGTNLNQSRSTPVTTFVGGNNWKQVDGKGDFITAVKIDGTLWTWGINTHGQLGINNTTNRSTPVTTFAGGTDWKQVSSGAYSTVATKTDGTLWTWGDNNFSQLGNNTPPADRLTPVTTFAGGTNWKQCSYLYRHMAANTYIDDYQ